MVTLSSVVAIFCSISLSSFCCIFLIASAINSSLVFICIHTSSSLAISGALPLMAGMCDPIVYLDKSWSMLDSKSRIRFYESSTVLILILDCWMILAVSWFCRVIWSSTAMSWYISISCWFTLSINCWKFFWLSCNSSSKWVSAVWIFFARINSTYGSNLAGAVCGYCAGCAGYCEGCYCEGCYCAVYCTGYDNGKNLS